MSKKIFLFVTLSWLVTLGVYPQTESKQDGIPCRVMEVFTAEHLGTTAIVFHQRDKADGSRLGELLLAHSGEDIEFETRDGRRHRAMVARMKSCFGRGLLLYSSREAALAPNETFVIIFPVQSPPGSGMPNSRR